MRRTRVVSRAAWGDGWDVWLPRKGFIPRHAFVDVAREFEGRRLGPEHVNGWEVRITSNLLCRVVSRAARTALPHAISIDMEAVAVGGTYQHRGVIHLHFDIRPVGNELPWERCITVIPCRSTDLKAWVFTKATPTDQDILFLRRRGDVRLTTWLRNRLTEPRDADRH
jgi:hypothetical protein